MYLDNALEGYWLERRRNLSDHTVADYSLTFNRLRDYLGAGATIEEITSDNLRAFLNYLQNEYELGDKTLANAWIALSALWTWAEGELKIAHILRGRVARPQYRRPAVVPYDKVEIAALLEACASAAGWDTVNGKRAKAARPTASRDRAIIVTLLDTGVRAQELCDFQIGDYDSRRGQLHVREGKWNKSRYVYLGDSARRALWRYLSARPAARTGDPLFATRTETHIDRKALYTMIDRCAARAGVQGANIHRFRHTFAISYLRNGGSVLELQAALGHEKMDTVRIYARLAEVDLQLAQRRASPADNWRL